MTNKNVIEIIDRLMNPTAEKIAYNATEVFTAIAHGYYYVRPGKKMLRFIDKIVKIINEDRKQCKTNNDTLSNAESQGRTVADMLSVARSMFDTEYYASQISRMVEYEEYDKILLERYLYWLDKAELKSVFEGILAFKRDFNLFISDHDFDRMMDELKTSSLVVIENDPCYYKEYDKRLDYIDNNWDFCFEYLNKELIIDIICRYANEDQVLLASMIKTFKYSDVRTAAELTGLAVYIEEAYGVDIFNPIITDENKVRTVDSDTKNSKLFYRNKAGNFKMAHV